MPAAATLAERAAAILERGLGDGFNLTAASNRTGRSLSSNCEHPHVHALLLLAEREPAMAGYCLAKALLLDEDRGLELDVDLMSAALGLAAPA